MVHMGQPQGSAATQRLHDHETAAGVPKASERGGQNAHFLEKGDKLRDRSHCSARTCSPRSTHLLEMDVGEYVS